MGNEDNGDGRTKNDTGPQEHDDHAALAPARPPADGLSSARAPGPYQVPTALQPTGPGTDGIDVARLLAALRENLMFILTMGIVVFAGVMGYTAVSSMTFRANGRMYLGELDGGRGSSSGLDIGGGAPSDVGSEIEILKSRSIVAQAILSSGTNVDIAPPDWQAPRYWKWRLHERNPELLDVADRSIVATSTMLDESAREPRSYRVVFRDKTEYQLFSESGKLGTGTLGVPLKVKGVAITLLPGEDEPLERGAVFDITVHPLDKVVESAIASLDVKSPVAASGGAEPPKILTLEFAHESPHKAAGLLRHLMAVYLEERQAWKTEDAEAAERFVRRQLDGMRESLDDTQQKLADYRSENPVVVLEGEAEAMVQQVAKYEEQRVQAKLLVANLEAVNAALRRPNPPIEAFMFGEAQDAVLQGMAASLSDSQRRLAELQGKFKAAAPDVKQQRSQVNAQLAMIRNYVRSRLARAQESLSELDGVIAEVQAKLRTVPSAELGLAQIGRESEVYSKMYSFLLEKQQQTAILKASTISKNRILDHPKVPLEEDSPKLGFRLMSGLVGMLLGALLVIARALFSPVLRTDAEVRAVVGHVPVFASVPAQALKKVRAKRGTPSPPAFDVLSGGAENFGSAEAFRHLRTNLYFAFQDGPGKVLLVTSPAPGDGKTTTALTLAAMLAADSKRALVIDADLRKPSHHDLAGLPLSPGLDGLLGGKCSWEEAIQQVTLSFGQFDSIRAGSSAHVELLSGTELARLLMEARAHYDFIIIDSASYPLVSDALTLAHLSDLVLSVLRVGSTLRRDAEDHMRGVGRVAHRQAVVITNSESVYYPYPRKSAQPLGEGRAFAFVEAARKRLQ